MTREISQRQYDAQERYIQRTQSPKRKRLVKRLAKMSKAELVEKVLSSLRKSKGKSIERAPAWNGPRRHG